MKNFFAVLVLTMVLGLVFLFFGGALILGNIWGVLVLVSLIVAVMISVFIHQETKFEELEARIKLLENKNEPEV